jgi:hypothetical protein
MVIVVVEVATREYMCHKCVSYYHLISCGEPPFFFLKMMGWASLIGSSPKKCYQSLGTPKIGHIVFLWAHYIGYKRRRLWAMDMGQSVVLLRTEISKKNKNSNCPIVAKVNDLVIYHDL